MGLIKAGIGALGGTLADQWKEFFYCDSLDSDILMIKGQKRTSGRSSNTKGEENIISNGSGIAVADGQCMMIVEQGKIVEVCAEPGEFTYDSSTEPSIFTGPLGASVKKPLKRSGGDLLTAEIPERISAYIILIRKKFWIISLARGSPCRSVWLIGILDSTLIYPFA